MTRSRHTPPLPTQLAAPATDHADHADHAAGAEQTAPDPGRRRFLGYLGAAPTLAAAAELGVGAGAPAAATLPGGPQPAEVYDLNDALTDAARPTANLITVVVEKDGTASFELPRSENGQGVTTSTAMLIAKELDLPVEKVHVTLGPARPELVFNQITGGSNTTVATFTPIRVAAAVAKGALLDAAAIELGDSVDLLRSKDGVITGPSGSVTYAELAEKAATTRTRPVAVDLKAAADYAVIGTPQGRLDARKAVTGTKAYTLDLDVPYAKPTMICRAPTLNGRPKRSATGPPSRRCPASPTSPSSRPASRARRDLRPVHRRGPGPRRGLARRSAGRPVRARRARPGKGRRGPARGAEARPAHQDRRSRLHLLVPLQQLARAERRHRRRARGQGRDLGRLQRTRSPPPRRSPPSSACRRRP